MPQGRMSVTRARWTLAVLASRARGIRRDVIVRTACWSVRAAVNIVPSTTLHERCHVLVNTDRIEDERHGQAA